MTNDRETIKFRGFCTESQDWIYGYHAVLDGVNYIVTNGIKKSVVPGSVSQYIGINDSTEWEKLPLRLKNEFTESIGGKWQGKEIYDTDILEIGASKYLVKWSKKHAGFRLYRTEGYMVYDHYKCKIEDIIKRKAKVVSNTYLYMNPGMVDFNLVETIFKDD